MARQASTKAFRVTRPNERDVQLLSAAAVIARAEGAGLKAKLVTDNESPNTITGVKFSDGQKEVVVRRRGFLDTWDMRVDLVVGAIRALTRVNGSPSPALVPVG